MIIFSETITPRLQFITSFIGNEILSEDIQLSSDINTYKEYNGPKLNYSSSPLSQTEFYLKPHSLLFEKNITPQHTDCFDEDGYKAFFKTEGDMPFDLFAASFFLLSRYEEYLPHTKDMYGRYAHENSLAYREKFLTYPLVNIWLQEFRKKLSAKFPVIALKHQQFSFIPTYDIDMAWSYLNKGWWRNTAGLFRSLIKGEWTSFKERLNVLRGKQKDPFDAYAWLNQLHEKHKLKPYYFFLLAHQPGKYDKNISPNDKSMQALIADQMIRYPIGIHPSWQSGDDAGKLKEEIQALSNITGNAVLSSRQHYIRFTLPATFRMLIEYGIKYDFSMGYGSINGFRASVASPYFWYDLENEKQTELLLFPFCYMEANSFYEQHYSPAQALEEMRHYEKEVKAVNGYLFTIWHNSFLGTDKLHEGWRDTYQRFIEELA